MTNPTNSKAGVVSGKDGARALPANGCIFGESPKRAPIARHPPTCSDASEAENLANATASSAPTR
jgi:hypothetical protein